MNCIKGFIVFGIYVYVHVGNKGCCKNDLVIYTYRGNYLYLYIVPGPYPPPPGVHNVSPVRKWSPGEVGTAVEVRRKRVPSNEGKI